MNAVYVNGLKLPDQLVSMLASGLWTVPEHKEGLARLGIEDTADLVFLSLEGMEANTKALREMVDKQGKLFGLVADRGERIAGFLDVTKAVMIAATRGQEALCLDYADTDTPTVVATHYEAIGVCWLEVARSFDELIHILKLRS